MNFKNKKVKLAALFLCVAIGSILLLLSAFDLYRDMGARYVTTTQKLTHPAYFATIASKQSLIPGVPLGCKVVYRGMISSFVYQGAVIKWLCSTVYVGQSITVYSTPSGYAMAPTPADTILTFIVFIFSGFGIRYAIRRLRKY